MLDLAGSAPALDPIELGKEPARFIALEDRRRAEFDEVANEAADDDLPPKANPELTTAQCAHSAASDGVSAERIPMARWTTSAW